MTDDVLILSAVATAVLGTASVLSFLVVPRFVKSLLFRLSAASAVFGSACVVCGLACVAVLWQAGNASAVVFMVLAAMLFALGFATGIWGVLRRIVARCKAPANSG